MQAPVGCREQPAWWDVFQARCGHADLGPISLNWFEELSLEAPPYNPEVIFPVEDSEYKASSYEPSLFKTPQRKPYQLASTPIIFKEQGLNPPLYQSPSKEAHKHRLLLGKDNKHRSDHIVKTKRNHINEVASPAPNACLSESPVGLPSTHVTPQREKSVVCGSLFHTPKLIKGQTPRCISESLGAEVDSDMSWSSSLATPPTLTSTVLLVKEEETRTAPFPDGTAAALKSCFSNHDESLRKNNRVMSSGPVNANHQKGAASEELRKMWDNSSWKVNNHKDQFGKSVPSVPKDEIHVIVSDVSEEDSFSLYVSKYKPRNLRRIKTSKSRKNIFSETSMNEYEKAKQQIEKNRLSFLSEVEPDYNNPSDISVATQKLFGNGSDRMSEEILLSLDSQKAQFTPLEVNEIQMEKIPILYTSSCGQNNSEKDLTDTEKDCTGPITLENPLPGILDMSDIEKAVYNEAVVNRSCVGHCLQSHRGSIPGAKPTVCDTSLESLHEDNKASRLRVGASTDETLREVFSNNITDPDLREETKPEKNNVCLEKEDSLHGNSVDNGSQPVSIKHTSAVVKKEGLISTLKKKRRRFIYAINDETTCQGEKLLKDQASQLSNCSTQLEANTSEALLTVRTVDSGFLHFSAKKIPEEPAFSLTSSYGMSLKECYNNENSSKNKLLPQDLDYSKAKINKEELKSCITTEAAYFSSLQEHHCTDNPKSHGVSDIKEEILPTPYHPAATNSKMDCSSTLFPSQESFLCDHGNTSILTSNPRASPSKPTVVSKGKKSCKMPEKLKSKNCEAGFELASFIPMEMNQQNTDLLISKNDINATPVEVQANQNPDSIIQKGQEEIILISNITVNSNSEELFPEYANNSVFQMNNERNISALENIEAPYEAGLSCVDESILKNSTMIAYTERDDKPAAKVLITEDFDSSDIFHDLTENRNSVKQQVNGTLGQDSVSDTLNIDVESNRNNEYRDKQTESSAPVSDQSFGNGFKTASNKEIKLSEHNIKKSKMLFKDIEEQYPTSFAYAGIANTLSSEAGKKQSKSLVHDSHPTNSVSGYVQSSTFASSSKSRSTVPPVLSLKLSLNSNHNLTPSQKAEVNELSTILEESGSQFEFTQFRDPNYIEQNYSLEISKNQTVLLNTACDDSHPHRLNSPSASWENGKKYQGMKMAKNTKVGQKQKFPHLLKANCNKSASGCLPDKNQMEFKGFYSALGTKLTVSNKALQKAMKLFSDIEKMEETSGEPESESFFSSKFDASIMTEDYTSVKNFSTENKCQLVLENNVEMTTDIFVKENTKDYKRKQDVDKCIGASINTCNLEKSHGSDTGKNNADNNKNVLHCNDPHNRCLQLPDLCVKEGSSQIKEGLSDLTCLEVVKTEELFQVNASSNEKLTTKKTREQLTTKKMRPNTKDFYNCDVSFQTASGKNIRVSKESLSKVVNFFDEKCTDEELGNLPGSLNSELFSGKSMKKTNFSSYEEIAVIEGKILKESDPISTENQPTPQEQADCETEKSKGPFILGFHTASGKKVKVTKESLDKVKNIFDEEKPCISEITNTEHEGLKALKEREENKEPEVACETVEVIVRKCERREKSLEKRLVPNETAQAALPLVPLSDHSHVQAENLRISDSTSLAVKACGSTVKQQAEFPVTCSTNQPTSSVTGNPAFTFYTGHGRKISVSQASLFEAKKRLREGKLDDQPEERNSASVACLKEYPQGYVGNPLNENSSSSSLTGKSYLSGKEDSADLRKRSVCNSSSYHSESCYSGEVCDKSELLSKNKLDNSAIEPVMKDARDGGNTSFPEVASTLRAANTYPQAVNEAAYVKKLSNCSPCKIENVVSKLAVFEKLETEPPSADGQKDFISHDTEAVRETLGDSKVKQNSGSTSATCRTEIAVDCHKVLDGLEDTLFSKSLDEECNMHSHEVRTDNQSEQTPQHNQSKSESEKASEVSPYQINCKTSGMPQLHVGDLPQSFSFANACGIFSTASGKAVQVSDASLQKARQVFSKLEDNAEQPFPEVFKNNRGHSDKCTKEKNTAIGATSKSLPFSGFCTAGGKQVSVSESALQKVKGMLEELDSIRTGCDLQPPPPSRQDVPEILPFPDAEQSTWGQSVNTKRENAFRNTCEHSGNHGIESESPGNSHLSAVSTSLSEHRQDEPQLLVGAKAPVVENLHCLGKKAVPENTGRKTATTETVSNLPVGKCSETEAVAIAQAFLEAGELTDSELLCHAKQEEAVSLDSRTGKRRGDALVSVGEPPIKRNLLNEFDRVMEKQEKSLKAVKSTPEGTMNDRRLYMHRMSLEPVTCGPLWATKKRQGKQSPNLTAPARESVSESQFYEFNLTLEKSSSKSSVSEKPLYEVHTARDEKRRWSVPTGKPMKVFVPPFKTKARLHRTEVGVTKSSTLEENQHRPKNIDELDSGDGERNVHDCGTHYLDKNNLNLTATAVFTEHEEDPSGAVTGLQRARAMQDARLREKPRQSVSPQPGSLYLAKASSAPRIPLRAAVGGRVPRARPLRELYMFGISKHCLQIHSENAESFQFHVQDYFGKEDLWAGKGVQLADGGHLIPSDDGKAGREEFYRALCDTPGVDPKLISRPWVYNHYRWVIWKLAAMERVFPEEFANRCLNPERVLLQLKYRYDMEIDRNRRSAIKKITERDETAARTLVLCVSRIVSSSANTRTASTSHPDGVETQTVAELTDGWYAIRAQLDPPLAALLRKGRLAVGQKIVTHGAELVGSPDACHPLEAPDSLMLKISANSTRPARWFAKLGFSPDPRPFPLPLSSLFSDGGNVGCVDVIIQRVYPVQWMEKTSSGLYIFRNEKQEEKEAAKYAEAQQKKLEALFTKIQAEFEEHEEKATKRRVPSPALTRRQIRALQDGAELYEALKSARDPAELESFFTDEQLKALNNHKQMLNDKRQAQMQLEFKKAVQSAGQREQIPSRDVHPVWKLQVRSYGGKERDSALLSIWRPSAELFPLLTEGKRCRISQLVTSKSKSKSVQLTATRKTQYQQLPASDELLFQVYQPRVPTAFNRLMDPDFHPPCSEVDLIGFVISVVKKIGLPVVYLSDECQNLLAIKFWIDINEDIVKPHMLIAASNLQWRPEPRPRIPTLYAGDFAMFSANPREGHFQETFHKMKSSVEDIDKLCSDAENELMHMLSAGDPKWSTPTRGQTSEPLTGQPVPDSGGSFLVSPAGYQSPASLCKAKGEATPSPASAPRSSRPCGGREEAEDPKACRKRRALDLLSRLPPPPPVSPVCTLVSPAAQKAFQPPRRRSVRHETPLRREVPGAPQERPPERPSDSSLLESDCIADEELALISTQALVPAAPTRTAPPGPTGSLRLQRQQPASVAREQGAQHSPEARGTSTSERPQATDT